MSNPAQADPGLQEWLTAASSGTSWGNLGVKARHRCAELFLSELPGNPCMSHGPVRNLQLAASSLADAAIYALTQTLWGAEDFKDLADRIPGLGALVGKESFRSNAAKQVRIELKNREVDDVDHIVNTFFGHPSIRGLITANTDMELARRANSILCASHRWARTRLPAYLQEAAPAAQAAAVTQLFSTLGSGPAHALWASWAEIEAALEFQYEMHGAGIDHLPGMETFTTELDPEALWVQEIVSLFRAVKERTWWRRNVDRRAGRCQTDLNHCLILAAVRHEVLDASGLAHSGLSSKENLRRTLVNLRGARELTTTHLASPDLAPLKALVKGAVTKGVAVYRPKVQSLEGLPTFAELLLKLIDHANRSGAVPDPSYLFEAIGVTPAEFEAVAPLGNTYTSIVEGMIDADQLPAQWSRGVLSKTAAAGIKLVFPALDGQGTPEVSLRELLPEELLAANWGLCRIDYVVVQVPGHPGCVALSEFDGEHHFVQVANQGILHECRERDVRRHAQLREIRAYGVDATMVAVHYDLLRKTPAKGGLTPEQYATAFSAIRAHGKHWAFIRATGCQDMRAHLGTAKRLDVGIAGIEVYVAD